MQIVTIAGTIGKDAVVRNTQGGESLVSFSVGVSNGKDRDGNWRDSTWWDCTIFGKRATDAVAGILRKGNKVTVIGRPTVRVYEGKAYLGVSVSDFTPQGGGQTRDERRDDDRGGGPLSEFEDSIPWAPEFRI